METASKRRHHTAEGEPEAGPSRGGLLQRHWFWTVLATSIVVVWLAPVVVSHTPLLNGILVRATAKLNGKVTVRSASLGWFSPISMDGVVILDHRGQTVAEIEHVSGDRMLSGIACNYHSLGRMRLQRPSLTLILRDDGSNVEDLLAKCLADLGPPASGQGPSIDAQIELVDGQITIHHVRTGRSWQIDNVQASCLLSADAGKPVSVKVSGVVANRRRPGQFALSGTIYPAPNPPGKGDRHLLCEAPEGRAPTEGWSRQKVPVTFSPPLASSTSPAQDSEILVRTDGLPLAVFGPLLTRLAPATRLGGRLTSSLVCRADAALDRISLQGTLTGEELRLAASSLGADPLRIARLDVGGKLTWQDGRLEVEQLTAKSDLGELSVSGTLAGPGKPGDSWAEVLSRQVCQLRGRLDLARLAATLPGTLRIRKGTEITSGQVSLTLAVQPDAMGSAWNGQIEASNLTAVNQGRQIVWRQPMQAALAAHATAQGPVVDSLKCDSSFLRVEASGTAERMAVSASFDLAQLASQLTGFVDLGPTQLAGGGWAQFGWQRSPQQTFQAVARLHLEDFHLALPQRPAWAEENLTATLAASGQTDFTAARIDAASLDLITGRDQTSVRLLQPVADLRGGTWPVEVHSEGDLARWIPRLTPWCAVADWRLGGTYNLGLKASASAGAVRLNGVQITADQLQVQGPGLHLAESRCQATMAGGWDKAERRLEVKSARVDAGGLALSADGLVVALPADGRVELSGVVDCQGDLDRLQQWIIDPAAAPAWRIAGQLASRTEFRQSPGTITAATTTTVRGLSVAHSSGQQFQEPEVRLTARASYDIANGTLVVQQAQLSSDCLAAGASGRLVTKTSQGRLDADGKLDYDLEKLSALARSFWGSKVQASGRGSNPFAYHGPLNPSAAGANASLAWQSAQVFGFQVGPGELRLALDRGVLGAGLQDLAVNEGRVRLAPEIRLASSLPATSAGAAAADRPAPAADALILYHAPGRIAEQIRINPELCTQALKFVAPVMANVGTAEGRFSVDIDRCRIPLANPAQGELLGRLTIHSAEVSPGPLVAELAVLLGRASPARINQESVITFRMADGRVYHDGMELVFPDLTIRTQGWVAFDDTLSLTAEMSVPPKWLASNPAAPTLRSQTIRLPVGGTLKRPVIDRKVLAQTSAQFIRNAAHNLIQEEFHRQVDRLLGPPQPVK
jgi:hypothetical protein